MTPNIQTIWDEVHERWPDVASWGTCNCRRIANSATWSQHAWCNAWDITSPSKFGPRVSWNLRHMKYLDAIYAYLVINMKRLGIRKVLWRQKDHWDHIHVDTWPRGYSTPPCKGAPLQVMYPDGTIGDSFGEEDIKEYLTEVQKSLNLAGFVGADGQPLDEDGVLGPNTIFAIQARDVAAATLGAKDSVARRKANKALDYLQGIKEALE